MESLKVSTALSHKEAAAIYATLRHLERSLDHSLTDIWDNVIEYYKKNRILSLIIDRFSIEQLAKHTSRSPNKNCSQAARSTSGMAINLIYSTLGVFTRKIYFSEPEISCLYGLIQAAIKILGREDQPEASERYDLRLALSHAEDLVRGKTWFSSQIKRANCVDHFNAPLFLDHIPLKDFL